MSDIEEEGMSWDCEHCPWCESRSIVMSATTKGEDTGDSGQEYEKWECQDCGGDWLSDMTAPQPPEDNTVPPLSDCEDGQCTIGWTPPPNTAELVATMKKDEGVR